MKPWLWIPAKWAHDLSSYGIEIYSKIYGQSTTPVWNSFTYKNLIFKNRIGIAGGVDKNADHLLAWQSLGCGFLEIGTVTPEAQKPNPGKIIDRDLRTSSLWNKMGFPSAGADEVFFNLRNFKEISKTPVFVNIGKNRTTPNETAHVDYIFLLSKFQSLADAFVLNISSPNTKGLRDLAKKENLDLFLNPIMSAVNDLSISQPLFIKLSPDLETEDLISVVECCLQHKIDGFILTNTTLSREGLTYYPSEGGASGKPVAELSKKALKTVVGLCLREKTKKIIISAGGVMTAADVFERIELGADLVQVYTALIFEGPGFIRKVSDFAEQRQQQQTHLSKKTTR